MLIARHRRVELARYVLRAKSATDPVEFQRRLTIDLALQKTRELKEAHFTHITILNVLTGVEITDLEELMAAQGGDDAKGA